MQRIATLALSLAAALAMTPAARAQAPGSSGVKIGILNDQSGVYADFGGKWSVEAAHMAVEDFGGKIFGKVFGTPRLIGIHNQLGFRGRLAHGGDAHRIAIAAKLDL